ncbi:hypothetical protein [Streptomyces sp. NBC_00356]|uniref:hypothetical protein n=1 Tax=Streptomyces sp. NBC_00356 TaxID=2975724 RepID=UPI002E2693B6
MASQPPQHDEDLIRFHNGDTLGNIPVVQLSEPAAAPIRRIPVLAVAIVGAGLLGSLAAVGAFTLLNHDRDAQAGHAPAGAAPISSMPTAPANTPAPTTPASPSAQTPSPSASPTTTTRTTSRLEQVRIIQTPPTGGDSGASYCLVYTGASSGTEREAILLMNAAGYQCQDMLPVDPTGENSPMMTEAPECAAPARAAVLSFAETGGWENEVMYTCLTEHHGA